MKINYISLILIILTIISLYGIIKEIDKSSIKKVIERMKKKIKYIVPLVLIVLTIISLYNIKEIDKPGIDDKPGINDTPSIKENKMPPPGHLVWSDEFNESYLDPSKWSFIYGSTKNLAFNNGSILMVAEDIDGRGYSSFAHLKSKFQFTYGYVEARMRISNTAGVDNELWLSDPGGDVHGGFNEVDILERPFHGNDDRPWCINSIFSSKLKWASSHDKGDYDCKFVNDGRYHIYGLLWGPDQIIYYADGIETWRAPSDYTSLFNKPMIFKMELCADTDPEGCSYQGMGAGGVNINDLPTNMAVDYVRIYQ